MISKIENIDEMIAKAIGSNIQSMRQAASLSRAQLAGMMGITYQQLYKYERGQNNISAQNLVYLKFYLGLTDYNLFYKGLF